MGKIDFLLFFFLTSNCFAGELTDKNAIVTGGSRGVGKASVLAFAREGANVAIVVNQDLEEAEEVAVEAQNYGVKTLVRRIDVTDPLDVQRMVDEVIDAWGRIDILVNAAKVADRTPAEELSFEDWQSVILVNLTGTFLCCQAVGKKMLEDRTEGSIINLSSISGHIVVSPQKQAHYNASRGGVDMLTKSLAAEWADRGIRVNAVSPGLLEMTLPDSLRHLIPQWLERIPMHRLGQTDDIANAILFLASPRSRYITGTNITIDGGYTLR